jgi:signal transduction histidine kinase
MDVPHLAGQFRERIGRGAFSAEADLSFPFPFLATPREVRVQLSSFEAHDRPYGLLVIRDVSHERSVAQMRETLGQMIVHDMKSPLSVVASNLAYVTSTLRDDPDAKEAVTDGLMAAKRLESMLVTLLDSSRLETNSFPLNRATVDVGRLAADAASLARAVARSRSVAIDVIEPPSPVIASVDAEVIVRICENLIDNAIRHAKRITVSVTSEASEVVISVSDDGPGVPPEQRERIFEKFAQVAPNAPHTRGLNRGLGLTFVQQAARAHGGDASIGDAPGGGALFRVRLPAAPPRPARASPPGR